MNRLSKLAIALTIGFLILSSNSTFAQKEPSAKQLRKHAERVAKSKAKGKFLWDLDTVYQAGVAVFVCEITESTMLGATHCDFKSLSGKFLGGMEYSYRGSPGTAIENIWTVTFTVNDRLAEFVNFTSDDVVESIYKQGIINGEEVNESAWTVLCNLKPPKTDIARSAAASGIKTKYVPIKRNTAGPIFSSGTELTQGGVTIATFDKNRAAASGTIVTTIHIYSPAGDLIARAVGEGAATTSYEVTTAEDKATYTVDEVTYGQEEKGIAEFLTNKLYL